MPAPRGGCLALIAALIAFGMGGCGSDGGATSTTTAATSASAGGGSGKRAQPPAPVSRLADPLRGGERVVFIGDSLPVTTPPTYADRLPAAIADRAPGVEVVNLAEPGSTSSDWLPGSELFGERLDPELAAADIVVVTLGGNDLQAELGGVDGLAALSRAGSVEALGGFVEVRDELEENLGRTFRRIRELAPQARVVYVSYPDYSLAKAWRREGGRLGALALRLGLGELLGAAEASGPDVVVDMLDATAGSDVDSLLADPEHLGPLGHELYARRLARALTG